MIRMGLIAKGGGGGRELLGWYEFETNSPRLLTPVNGTASAGLQWADHWLARPLSRPCEEEGREELVGPVFKGKLGFGPQPKGNRKRLFNFQIFYEFKLF
jgi:hypothetical protein